MHINLNCSRKKVLWTYLFYFIIILLFQFLHTDWVLFIFSQISVFILFFSVICFICKDISVDDNTLNVKYSFLPKQWYIPLNEIESIEFHKAVPGNRDASYMNLKFRNGEKKKFAFNYVKNSDLDMFFDEFVKIDTITFFKK